jgi:MoxR-vWA-beta-propeller ternary system domain bpX4
MSALTPFLDRLLTIGEARLTGRPEADERQDTDEVLRRAFGEYRLDLAGPLLDIDANAALHAALFMARAYWFAVSRDESPAQVKQRLPAIPDPTTPAAHASIDSTLRYAVTIYRRVHAQNAEDVLAIQLAEVLRRCPLTGVRSDVSDPAIGDVAFGGHTGLQLLYAERLAAKLRPAWLPPGGRIREAIDLVYQHLVKKLPGTTP